MTLYNQNDETPLPDDVFIALVTGLFAIVPSMLMGVGGVIIVAGKVALQNNKPLFWVIFAVALVSSLTRIVLAVAFEKRGDGTLTKIEALLWERRFAVTSFLAMATIGMLILAAFPVTDYDPDLILADGLGCGMAAGTAARGAGRLWIAKWQIILLMAPIIAGSFWRSETSFWILGGVSVLFLVANLDIMRRLNRQIVDLLLARRVQDLTAELEGLNKALALAKAEAEAANIPKTRFLAAASHDLLQPLNAARLYATSLREQIELRPGRAERDLAVNVEASLEAVEDIVTALLDISRFDARATGTDISCFSLNGLFRQLKAEFDPLARGKEIELRFLPSSLPVVSDAELLKRVLQNLLSNAIKYTPKGRIVAGARRAGGMARIEVWDTGIGIPSAKHSDIFREFERLPAAAAIAPGLGLGLSIVERIGVLLAHQVAVRSKPGRGSVFSVTVPIGGAHRLRRLPAADIDVASGNLAGLIVAVIDKDSAILSGMSALLQSWNCRIFVGESYVEIDKALCAATAAPDVVLAGYHLDSEDGITIVARLRQRFGPCHAALLSPDRSLMVHDKARALDIRVLNKPIKPAALRAVLARCRLAGYNMV